VETSIVGCDTSEDNVTTLTFVAENFIRVDYKASSRESIFVAVASQVWPFLTAEGLPGAPERSPLLLRKASIQIKVVSLPPRAALSVNAARAWPDRRAATTPRVRNSAL
jgi:hypothetical protein